MTYHAYYILPFIAAGVYALASIFIKKSMEGGVGATRMLFLSNVVMALCMLPLLAFHRGPIDWTVWLAPVAGGVFLFFGAWASFIALRVGDVSVATPAMGTKVLFVALFSVVILGESIPLEWWIGAVLTTGALALLGGGKKPGASADQLRGDRGVHLKTLAMALLSAAAFAGYDVIAQGWARQFGLFPFSALSTIVLAICSLVYVPKFQAPLREIPAKSFRTIIIATVLIATQFFILTYTLSTFGDATAMNIIYSSRGLWSVALVWMIGPMLGNVEKGAGTTVLIRRSLGSALLLVAIALVLLGAQAG